jgi:hypothetical protein
MIKLNELMPDMAKRIADDEAHRAGCRETYCDRCDRPRPKADREQIRQAFRSADVARVLERIPPVYAGAELTASWLVGLVGAQTVGRCHQAIAEPSVAFLGPPGSGKSSLAAAMFRLVARAELDTKRLLGMRWVSSHKLAKARAGQPLGEGESPLVEMALDASVLVLDELGGEDPRYASAVGEVLFERHAQALPTWVTTGVGNKEIATRYGGGIARRVFEGAAVFRLGSKT